MNFQKFKLVLEKAEEPEIKLPTSAGSLKKQESSKKTYFYFIDNAKAFDCVDPNKLENSERWEYQTTWPASWETCIAGQEATVRTGHETTDWFQIGKGVRQGCLLSPCLFYLYAEYIMRGWKKHSWNQDCWEKHQ